MRSIDCFLFGVLFFSPIFVLSNILRVPSEYSTIQAGMDAADTGDTVLVADGIYTGEGNLFLSFAGKAMVVKSENGPENCIIDCVDGEGIQAFLIINGETRGSVVDGFRIINGCSVIVIENSSPTIKNNISENNNSGVYCGENSNPLIENNVISNSKLSGIYCYNSTGIIRNNTISRGENSGIACQSSLPVIENNNISQNWYSGIAYYNSGGNAQNNIIEANYKNGIYCNFSSNPIINGNSVIKNRYPGIYCKKSSPKIIRNLIKNNGGDRFNSNLFTHYDRHQRPSEIFIGSAFHGGISVNDTSDVDVQNNILMQNKGTVVGAIFCDSSSSVNIINNHIVDNSSIYGGSVYIQNASSKIINNIIVGAKSSDSNERISRWYMDDLFAKYTYDGAKLDYVTYYFGFINNGPPGEVQISGCTGLSTSVWAETGERFWVEAHSDVIEGGNGGGFRATVSLDTSSFSYDIKRYYNFIPHGCLHILSPVITSYGVVPEGKVGVGIIAENQDNIPEIAYNNVYGNKGGNYIFSDSVETKSSQLFDLNEINGNVSQNPLFNPETFELINGSPCIDAGSPDTTGLNIGFLDFNGNGRFFDASASRPSIIDIGAFEFQGVLTVAEKIELGSSNYYLGQNYPNPFRRQTEIAYWLPEACMVHLEIYGVNGVKIKSLVNKRQVAGRYSLNVNIEDFSSGIYFYRLKAGNYVETKKMVIE